MGNNINEINWQAVAALGSWVGGLATFVTVIIALLPYKRQGKIYFTFYSNIVSKPILSIVNSLDKGLVVTKIEFYSKKRLRKRTIFSDNFLEQQDDLVSDKSDNYIQPYGQKILEYDPDRIIHYMTHRIMDLKKISNSEVRIIVYTNRGKIKGRTQITVKDFVNTNINMSENFNHLTFELIG